MAEASSPAVPAGLTYSEDGYGDRYIGTAEALIAAGLITANQLPGQPGQNKMMCTFYAGVQVRKGSYRQRDEHYLSIRRIGRNFEVIKGVPEHVYDARSAARQAQWEIEEAQQKVERAAQRAAKAEEEKREYAKKQTPDSFRESCLSALGSIRWRLDGAEGYFPFSFSSDARAEIEEVLRELEGLFGRGQVLPLHPSRRAGKAHLRLAWSAA